MIFDSVFSHRNVLEAVTCPDSLCRPCSQALGCAFPPGHPAAPRLQRSPRAAQPGCCSSRCAALPPEWGPCRASARAGHVLVAQVAGAGHVRAGDIPWPGSGWHWCGRSSSRTRGYTIVEKLESSFCLSLVHFTDMKIEKGEIYEENLISHSCWMDLVWYWPDFTMCLLKALEYILYVKDCNNFKKRKKSW